MCLTPDMFCYYDYCIFIGLLNLFWPNHKAYIDLLFVGDVTIIAYLELPGALLLLFVYIF